MFCIYSVSPMTCITMCSFFRECPIDARIRNSNGGAVVGENAILVNVLHGFMLTEDKPCLSVKKDGI